MEERAFYKTDEEFAKELAFTISEFRAAKKKLKDDGYISIERRGLPAKTFYFVNAPLLLSSLEEMRGSSEMKVPDLLVEKEDSLYIHRVPQKSTQEMLPDFLGKTPTARLVTVYGLLYKDLTGFTYQANWPALTKLFKPLLESMSEWQIAAMIALHFNWYGANGDDEFAHKRLASASFPLEWVPNSVNQYRPYIQNHLHVPFDDHESVKKHVTKIIKPLYQTYAK